MEEQVRSNLILGTVLESKDEIDKKIVDDTINMIVGLQIGNFLIPEKKKDEEYFGHIMNVAESLFKANSHRRRYIDQEKKILEEFKNKCLTNTNTVDLSINSVDLTSEIEGVLTQIKSALDSLARSFSPLLGLNLHGWHKKKKESGREVLDVIDKNLPNNLKDKSENLKNYIEKNIPWISYVVFLRDGIHRGGLKNISAIIYRQTKKDVEPQHINYGNANENVTSFITRLLNEITEFSNAVILLSLLVKAPENMCIVKNEGKEWPPYTWRITNIDK